jgi:sulfur carrier protein
MSERRRDGRTDVRAPAARDARVIALTLNGKPHELPDGATVDAVVHAAGAPADGRGVAVAVNGEVVPRGAWADTPVRPGQEIEVLQAVQGG